MANLAAFEEADFDAKRFINEACTAHTSAEPIDRYLAELEMKLHLASEDISLHLEDQAMRASQRIPATIRELLHIKDDAVALRASVTASLSQLERDDAAAPAAAASVHTLEELDAVKQRMEAACSTLKEAAGLSSLFHLVDEHFAAGDYARIAEALAGIRRGLSIVGDSVPEFRDGGERLDRLEDRFAAAVEAPLSAAFTKQRGEDAVALSDMLAAAGKADRVAALYTAARAAPLQALWDSYAQGTPFISWLGTFYDSLIHAMSSEAGWAKSTLPARFPALPLALLSAFLTKIDKPFRARLAGALAGATGSVLPLESLEQAQSTTADFAGGLQAALAAVGAFDAGSFAAFVPLYRQIIAPVEALLQGYADREAAFLTAELHAVATSCVAAAGAAPEGAAKALSDVIARALASCEAALTRCVRLTQGTSLPALARVLDRALAQHLTALQAVLPTLRGRVGGEATSLAAAEAVLPLLLVGSSVVGRVAELDAAVVVAGQASLPLLQPHPRPLSGGAAEPAAAGTAAVPDAAALRLEAHPALRQQLSAFVSSSSVSSGGGSLPAGRIAAGEFAHATGALVEDVLCAKIRSHLGGVAGLAEWRGKATSGVALPTFTPYPLQYITSVGEYLMMLPQLLESALGAEDDTDEAGQLVADWIDRVSATADALYQEQLSQVQGLSEQGAGQLAADLEYFTNVLTTLGVAVAPTLAAWQAAAGAGREDLPLVLAAARESADEHAVGVVMVVAKMRGVGLSGWS